jgi:hypothetical protein
LCSLNNFSWKVEVNPSWLEKGISPGKKNTDGVRVTNWVSQELMVY